MLVSIVKIGNSRGIRIPKPLLEQAGIADSAELTLEAGRLVIGPAQPKPRAGWTQALDRLMADDSADKERFEDIQAPANAFDEEEWTWPEQAPVTPARQSVKR